jgi:hypothetical protein
MDIVPCRASVVLFWAEPMPGLFDHLYPHPPLFSFLCSHAKHDYAAAAFPQALAHAVMERTTYASGCLRAANLACWIAYLLVHEAGALLDN